MTTFLTYLMTLVSAGLALALCIVLVVMLLWACYGLWRALTG